MNTINDIEDKDELIRGYNFAVEESIIKKLVIKDNMFKLISKLQNL